MARLRIYKNVFEKEYEDFTYDLSKSITENLEAHEQGDYSEMVECYDPETNETFFAPFLDDESDCAVVIVNGNSVSADYKVQENDELNVYYMPQSQWYEESMGMGPGGLAGMLVGGFVLGVLTGGAGWGIFVGAIIGGLAGFLTGLHTWEQQHQTSTTIDNSKKKDLPDVRGSSNQSLVNNPYPFVMGKHLTVPQIVGDPYTEYSGTNGEDAYIRAVYCLGSAPLKLTDFKLGDIMLAYNRTQGVERQTVLNGLLKGYSQPGGEADSGDILDIWRNNDIELEIIQQPNGEETNYGHIYPNKITQSEINASVLYINDTQLTDEAKVVYKGVSFPDKFRTNGVWFTESCPMQFTINLVAQSGLYASRSRTNKDGKNTVSDTQYKDIPLWYAIQWRPYDSGNASSDSNGNDYGSWNNITEWNNHDCSGNYNSSAMSDDKNAHTGNDIEYESVDVYSKTPVSTLSSLQSAWTSQAKTESDITVTVGYGIKNISIGSKNVCIIPADDTRYIVGKIRNGDSKDNVVFDSEKKILYVDAYNQMPSSGQKLIAEWMDEFQYFDTNTITRNITIYDYYTNNSSQRTASSNFQAVRVAVLKKYFNGSKTTKQSISGAWIDRTLTNFKDFSGEDFQSEVRLSSTVTLTKEQCKQMLSEYNKISGIEIRVIRVSPNYLNDTTSTSSSSNSYPKYGAFSYSDLITVSSITTKSFDRRKLEEDDVLAPVKIQSEADMKRNVYVAIKAKADTSGNIQNNLEQLSCISQSLSPTWDKEHKKWLPEGVKRIDNYWGYINVTDTVHTVPFNLPEDFDVPSEENKKIYVCETESGYKRVVSANYSTTIPDCFIYYGSLSDGTEVYEAEIVDRSNSAYEIVVDKKTYESARQLGKNWYREKAGSNYQTIIKDEVFSAEQIKNDLPCWYLKDEAQKYLDSNSASSFMLCAVGPQNGPVAYGYENINLLSAGEWYEDCESVKDGSTEKGNDISIRMEANGYVTGSQKLEQLLSEVAATGRAIYTYDEEGKISVMMDKPASYPAGVINEQNIITESNTFSYAESPAGLRIEFDDENDGYEHNSFYCWADGNSLENYHGQVENYGFKYITNPRQAWSLGRYLLASRIQQKEAITVKIGREGRLFPILSTVLVQSNELMIGNGSGRIRQILEDSNYFYGFYIDSTFDYDGETVLENNVEVSKMGVTIFQPKEYGDSRCVTLRLKKENEPVNVGGITYKMKIGTTNLVLFNGPVLKTPGTDPSVSSSVKYRFKSGDIAMFGIMEKISARYKVAKIKPESKGQYTEILYPYDDSLYNYGAELPSFQSHMTNPPVSSPVFDMSETGKTIAERNNYLIDTLNSSLSAQDTYFCELTMANIGSSVNVKVYKNGITATGTLYYSDFYGTEGNPPSTTGPTGTVTNGSATIAAQTGADKHLVKIYLDSNRTDLLCSALVTFGDGKDSTSYWLIEDAASIKKDSDGDFTPQNINLTAKAQTGIAAITTFSGIFKVDYATVENPEENDWTNDYTSAQAESSHSYQITRANAKVYRCSVYLSDGTTLVDQDVIPVVSDGIDGGYQDYKFAVGAFDLDDTALRNLTWYETPPATTEQSPCLYMATKWID